MSGAYDGKIKVWDLQAALDTRKPPNSLCIRTLMVWFVLCFVLFQNVLLNIKSKNFSIEIKKVIFWTTYRGTSPILDGSAQLEEL